MVAGERPVIERALVLTFDDGYRNNIREALPVLRKHGAPATFFVATGFVGNGRSYWIDRLDYALQAAPDEARRFEASGLDFDLRGGSRAELANGYRQLRLAVKARIESDEEMLEVMHTLAESLEEAAGTSIEDVIGDDPFASVASWNELGKVAHDGVLIGSHTVDHLRLDGVDEHSMAGQLRYSKAEIEQRLGIECAFFCYPNGNFDAQVVAKTREAGYRAAVTTQRGLNAVGDDVYTLKRYGFPTRATAFDNLLAISGLAEAPVLRRLAGRAG
jgi:peptidoglycan/xylan/chitin deacetylase (PgdA/CDA1 family)